MPTVQLSVILPTYQERANIAELIERICSVLQDLPHEVIVMDDRSPDATAEAAREAARRWPSVRVIEREPPAGLTASILEGVTRARGQFVAWLDADFSHPPELLPQLFAPLRDGVADLTCASRYVEGGRDVRDSRLVRVASVVITRLAHWTIDRRVIDYTTGYVMARRDLILELGLRGDYGEYCIDLLATAVRRGYRVCEVPYQNVERVAGKSKTAPTFGRFAQRGWRYLTTIGSLAVGRRP